MKRIVRRLENECEQGLEEVVEQLEEKGITYIGNEYDIVRSKLERKIRKFYKENRYYVGTTEEYDELIKEEVMRAYFQYFE